MLAFISYASSKLPPSAAQPENDQKVIYIFYFLVEWHALSAVPRRDFSSVYILFGIWEKEWEEGIHSPVYTQLYTLYIGYIHTELHLCFLEIWRGWDTSNVKSEISDALLHNLK